ncbi:LacI family DNA-binding transcriptional regulator [Acuticoccus mangrovi]|uniref:LacI family DNA-binding transcriptional regulator n=1 Tax=Acuticoccus mangrovi TaxID=2796142 RepID=A0A934INH8_9HYPH|nr:LacI family DNA-binding transcriptional regulator [Acuticoccus mangrovi]MBJ3775140.1 LacI family DNA-binding transcriptional regulator [Acuticoccus mangrovi]
MDDGGTLRAKPGRERGRKGPARLTISELAARIGVSKGTVSRALNGYPDVSEETRRRVHEAAAMHGYAPLSTARRLATGTTRIIGIVREAQPAPMSEAFLGEFIGGASAALAERGYDLLFATPTKDEAPIASYRRLLDEGRVDGFILYRSETDDARVRWLREWGAPFVVHGRTRDESGYAWLDTDNIASFYDATTHLAGLGHRRIAMVTGPERFNFVRLRTVGYVRAMAEMGVPPHLIASDLSPRSGYLATRAILAGPTPPTAIVAITDAVALGVMHAAIEAGLDIPGDISIVGCDGVESAAWAARPLTTMATESRHAGARLAEMLLALIGGADPDSLHEIWRAHLLRRASDAPPRAQTRQRQTGRPE